MIAIFPLVIALIGALLYALCSGKAQELGRLLFLCGMMALAFTLSGHAVKVL